VTRPVFDPADPTSRGIQITDSVRAKLEDAAKARAALGPTREEKALAKSIKGLVVTLPPKAKP
jgi:hypothetical protein